MDKIIKPFHVAWMEVWRYAYFLAQEQWGSLHALWRRRIVRTDAVRAGTAGRGV